MQKRVLLYKKTTILTLLSKTVVSKCVVEGFTVSDAVFERVADSVIEDSRTLLRKQHVTSYTDKRVRLLCV